tara:strand:- start:242 stop:1411 length:1170 start_codon:yes stop_codon:yes gene_type:complete
MNETIPRLVLNLIGPGTISVFGLGFVGAWLIDRKRVYLLALATACLMFGTGMVVQVFHLPPDFAINALVSNLCYTIAVLMVSHGLLRRSGGALAPWFAVATLALTSGLIAYFCYVDRDVQARIYVQNFGFGAILLLTAIQMRSLVHGRLIDRILFWTLLVFSVQFFPRTLLTAASMRQGNDPAGFGQSMFWQTLQLSLAVLGAALALTMLIAALTDVIEDMRHERDIDELTGVRNRRGFEQLAERLLSRTGASAPSLIIADIDHFKQINDGYGHALGDAVLRRFGTMLAASVRGSDVVFRIGGEEFAILLPEGGGRASELIARLQSNIAQTDFALPDRAQTITASFGVAVALPGESRQSWYARADKALYAAKHQGRDRAIFADPAVALS